MAQKLRLKTAIQREEKVLGNERLNRKCGLDYCKAKFFSDERLTDKQKLAGMAVCAGIRSHWAMRGGAFFTASSFEEYQRKSGRDFECADYMEEAGIRYAKDVGKLKEEKKVWYPDSRNGVGLCDSCQLDYIPPKLFVTLAAWLDVPAEERELKPRCDVLMKRIEKGEPLDPAQLWIHEEALKGGSAGETKTMSVSGHEGRHRAYCASMQGVKLIPVITKHPDNYERSPGDSDTDIDWFKLRDQMVHFYGEERWEKEREKYRHHRNRLTRKQPQRYFQTKRRAMKDWAKLQKEQPLSWEWMD